MCCLVILGSFAIGGNMMLKYFQMQVTHQTEMKVFFTWSALSFVVLLIFKDVGRFINLFHAVCCFIKNELFYLVTYIVAYIGAIIFMLYKLPTNEHFSLIFWGASFLFSVFSWTYVLLFFVMFAFLSDFINA